MWGVHERLQVEVVRGSGVYRELAMAGEAKEAAKKAAEEKKAVKVARYTEKFGTRVRLPRAAKTKNIGPGDTSSA